MKPTAALEKALLETRLQLRRIVGADKETHGLTQLTVTLFWGDFDCGVPQGTIPSPLPFSFMHDPAR